MIKYLFLFVFCFLSLGIYAQNDDTQNETEPVKQLTYRERLDSIRVANALEKKRIDDSVKHVQDSLQMQWVKMPDANRPNLFLDSLKDLYTVKNGDFFTWHNQFKDTIEHFKAGAPKHGRDNWIMGVIIALLLFFAVIRVSYPNEIMVMIQGFFNNRVLTQISKEENLFNSWPFIFLYLLFGFTIGLFLYLVSTFTQLGGIAEGFNLYLIFSLSILVLFTLKIVTLRFIGFLFDVPRLVREYVSILYLSYFNTALMFLPVVVIMAFSPKNMVDSFIIFGVLILAIIFFVQFLRAGTSIFKTYSLSKFYLFLYLCTLEIGPILILVKVLGF